MAVGVVVVVGGRHSSIYCSLIREGCNELLTFEATAISLRARFTLAQV